jgi:hypothetical protein
LKLVPSENLSANEIAAAGVADQGEAFNPQQQFPVTWPAEPVVARAYLDQLARDDALDIEFIDGLSQFLDQAGERLAAGKRDKELAGKLARLADRLGGKSGSAIIAKRRAGLAQTLGGIAERLR